MNSKESILRLLKKCVDEKEQSLTSNIKEITLSRNTEDKSSAGDKHETGRAMVEIELNNLRSQLSKINQSKQRLQKIIIDRKTDVIGIGNLIETNQGTYYMSIGLGKIRVDGIDYFAISPESPIGSLFMGRKKGESISFRNNEFKIHKIL